MLLYTSHRAPNPRRVTLYVAEKGLQIPTRVLDLGKSEHFTEEYAAVNPDHVVPTLVLDDGTVIMESIAICRALEAMHPEPPMFGRDPREIGLVEMWLRQVELQAYLPTQDAYRNSRRGFRGRALPGTRGDVDQIPELVVRSNATIRRFLPKADRALAGAPFLTGSVYTMADIVLLTTLAFGKRTGFEAVQDLSPWPNVMRWFADVTARPASAPDPT